MSTKTKTPQPVNRIAAPNRPEPTHDEIALCAVSIWEAEGCPQDRAVEHWLLAEARLRQGCQPDADAAPGGRQPRRAAPNGSKRTQPQGMAI